MKKTLTLITLALFFSLAFLGLFLRSSWGEKKLLHILQEKASLEGISFSATKIEGSLSSSLWMENVSLDTPDVHLSVRSAKVSLSPLSLLRGKLVLSHVHLTQVSLPNLPLFDLEGELRGEERYLFCDASYQLSGLPSFRGNLLALFSKTQNSHVRFSCQTPTLLPFPQKPLAWDGAFWGTVVVEGPFSSFFASQGPLQGTLRGSILPTVAPKILQIPTSFSGSFARKEEWRVKGKIENSLGYVTGSIELSPTFSLTSLTGDWVGNHPQGKGHISFENPQGTLHLQIPSLEVRGLLAHDLDATIEVVREETLWKGSLSSSFSLFHLLWQAKTPFSYSSFWEFPQIQITSPALSVQGSLSFDTKWLGTLEGTSPSLHPFFPNLYGKGDFSCTLLPDQLTFVGEGEDLYYKEAFVSKGGVQGSLLFPLSLQKGDLSWYLEGGKWRDIFIDQARFSIDTEKPSSPFAFSLDGTWKSPLFLSGEGTYGATKNTLLLQDLGGSIRSHPLELQQPFLFSWKEDQIDLSPLSLQLGEGSLLFSFLQDPFHFQTSLEMEKFPLDLLSSNSIQIPIEGSIDLVAILQQEKDNLEGTLQATISHLQADQKTFPPLSLSCSLTPTTLSYDIQSATFLSLQGTLPLEIHLFPLSYHLSQKAPLSGTLQTNLRLDPFFDFAFHKIEGLLQSSLSWQGSLASPKVEGTFALLEGSYQNYQTGTEILHIEAKGKGKGSKLQLLSFVGKDLSEQGTLTAQGTLDLRFPKNFPLKISSHLDAFGLTIFDLANGQVSGDLSLEGTLQHLQLQGSLIAEKGHIALPASLPPSLPKLPITYRYERKPSTVLVPPPPSLLPLSLAISLHTKDPCIVEGHGIESTWSGSVELLGSTDHPFLEGSLHLDTGKFTVFSRTFTLTDGTISFTKDRSPYLDLGSSIDVHDISIFARLQGPLAEPQITFQSNPPLPMGTILSYLLFGQTMTEISSLQALQLANSLASLANNTPNILELTRKSLGLDRFQVTTVQHPTEEGKETIAVQVGKYVLDDVLVSVTQGAEDASTNIQIEVELRGGVSFLLESEQAQEQGKFTLKWSHVY